MLRGFPVEVTISGEGMRSLATSLAQEPWIRGLDFSDDGRRLHVRVNDKGAFQERLLSLGCQEGVRISSIESPDGSLEAAFDLLLSVHRGQQAIETH